MGGMGGIGQLSRLAQLLGLGAACLALAHCSSGPTARIDPRYGVAASARVVNPGEPVPKGGGVYRVGKPYMVGGRQYVPQENTNYTATGLASWYGDDFHGRYTANGEVFDMNSISAAHPTLPLPSYVRVTNLANHRSIVVRVNDRGPYVHNRIIDVSVRTAKLLGFYGEGVTRVKVDYVGRAPLEGSDDRKLVATLREGAPGQSVLVASNRGYAPYLDNERAAPIAASVPTPPDRPFRLGEGAREVPAAAAQPAQTVEFAAAARARPPRADAEPQASPISAYAPTRYDGQAGFMGGRGLY
jgi:rare lipoprotein A